MFDRVKLKDQSQNSPHLHRRLLPSANLAWDAEEGLNRALGALGGQAMTEQCSFATRMPSNKPLTASWIGWGQTLPRAPRCWNRQDERLQRWIDIIISTLPTTPQAIHLQNWILWRHGERATRPVLQLHAPPSTRSSPTIGKSEISVSMTSAHPRPPVCCISAVIDCAVANKEILDILVLIGAACT